jgi:hypothetical protein
MVSRIVYLNKHPSYAELADSLTTYFESKNQQCSIFQLLCNVSFIF